MIFELSLKEPVVFLFLKNAPIRADLREVSAWVEMDVLHLDFVKLK